MVTVALEDDMVVDSADEVEGIVRDAVLTGLFGNDSIADVHVDELVPIVTLKSGRKVKYVVGLNRWTDARENML